MEIGDAAERIINDMGEPEAYLILARSDDKSTWLASRMSALDLKEFIRRLYEDYPYLHNLVEIVRQEEIIQEILNEEGA